MKKYFIQKLFYIYVEILIFRIVQLNTTLLYFNINIHRIYGEDYRPEKYRNFFFITINLK